MSIEAAEDVSAAFIYTARGANRMTDAPAMQMAAPAMSQRSGRTPSASHSQASEAAI